MFIGIDIGGTKISLAASSDGRNIDRRVKFASPSDPAAGLTEMTAQIQALSAGQQIKVIGVAAPGALDLERGIMIKGPNLAWNNLPIADRLSKSFNCSVRLINDATAAALAEVHNGAAQNHPYVLYITISTGVNTELIINGQPYHGNRGMEAGHIIIHPGGEPCGCGGRGHLEAYASGSALKRRFGKFGHEISDPKVWDAYAADLALGVFNLATALSPDVIVLGGGVSVHFDRFIEPLHRHLAQLPSIYPLPPILQAQRVEEAGLYGALALAAS